MIVFTSTLLKPHPFRPYFCDSCATIQNNSLCDYTCNSPTCQHISVCNYICSYICNYNITNSYSTFTCDYNL